MASKWVKMKFLALGVNRKVVGNDENYLNMKFQLIIFTRSRENAKKPHFSTYFLIWLPSICENRHTVYESCRYWPSEHFWKVWSLYPENFLRKIIFNAYWLQSNREMASKWVKMKFLVLGVNRKVVGNVENYLNMKFQPKIFTRSQDIAKKPHFWA